MSELLTAEGYEQTREKLRDLETRLAEIENALDLAADHLASVRAVLQNDDEEVFARYQVVRSPANQAKADDTDLSPMSAHER